MQDKQRVIRAAAVQAEPVMLDLEGGIKKTQALIAEAGKNGAELVVFPELFLSGYISCSVWGKGFADFGSDRAQRAWQRLHTNSIAIPSAETDLLCEAAKDAQAIVAIGLHERSQTNSSLYNTLLFIGSDGYVLGKHRKLMPTNHERMVHGLGDGSTLLVYNTPQGRIGGLICWENWMPLARYALYNLGEQIHVAPTADDRTETTLINARNTAIEGGVFVISVCSTIRASCYPRNFEFQPEIDAATTPEDDYLARGNSAIIAPDGEILAGPLFKEEEILYADLELAKTVRAGQLLDNSGHYVRPDVFQLHIDTRAKESIVEN
jgi:nitrilase